MFFILSKLLYFLLLPVSWIVLLLIWRWLARSPRVKKRLLVMTLAILVLFTNPFLYRSLVRAWQPELVRLTDSARYSAGIVLGGLSSYDRHDQGFFSLAADRFIQTANLYHQGIIQKIVISGGTGNLLQREPPEADFLRSEFIKNGIPGADIIVEQRSRNTYENAIFSKRLLDSLQLRPPYVLITSAMHMPRSEAVFKKAGFNCINFPCDYTVIDNRFDMDDYFIPNISLLVKWSWLLKEIIGLQVYRLTGKA